MKPHPIVASVVAAAVPAVLIAGFHFATRVPEEAVAASPGRTTAGMVRGSPTGGAVSPDGGETALAPRDPRTPPRHTRFANRLGISPSYLDEARRLADEMASGIGRDLSVLEGGDYDLRSHAAGDPSRLLGLRLGAGPELLETLGGILAEDRARGNERRIAAEKDRLERKRMLLDSDRDAYVNYLALEAMVSRGHPLSDEQAAFHKEFVQAGERGAETADEREWHEKPELLDEMRRHLSPDQRAELAEYVDEQRARERERQDTRARMRSGMIADRLGLDESERTALFEHLRGNPDASGQELKEILAPELRELLPPGL